MTPGHLEKDGEVVRVAIDYNVPGKWAVYLDGKRVELWSEADVERGYVVLPTGHPNVRIEKRGRVEIVDTENGRVYRREELRWNRNASRT